MAVTVEHPDSARAERPAWTDYAHVGPGTLAGSYLRRYWHPVSRSVDLAAGKARPLKILNEDFTLYRGASGQVYAVAFRCAHRLTQLNSGWVEGETIRCRYHGWRYDGTGQCVEQPAEPRPFCEKVKIASYPTEEYLGLIFVYFGADDPPPLPRYPELEAIETREVTLHMRMCSYFNNLENSCDESHIAFTHRDAFDSYVETVPEISAEETDYGLIRYGRRPGDKVRIAHIHMPNMQQLGGAPRGPGSGWQGSIAWRVPVDDETHLIPHITFLQSTAEQSERRRARRGQHDGPPPDSVTTGAAILAGRLSFEEIVDRRTIVPIQDEVTQVGQGRIADREHERLGQSDLAIILLRRIYSRELRALAEGRLLKEWKRSSELDLLSDE